MTELALFAICIVFAWIITAMIHGSRLMNPDFSPHQNCADCGCLIGQDSGPPDGWQLEDGRTVCHACCVADFKQLVAEVLRDQPL